MKKLSLCSFLLITSACQLKMEKREPSPSPSEIIDTSKENLIPETPAKSKVTSLPKIGLILGAGAAKTFAHIGFLREISNHKIPIHSIIGIEMAAPMAALYAHQEMANEVEWKMFKLKEDKILKNDFLTSTYKPQSLYVLNDFLTDILNGIQTSQIKIPFGCPAFNIQKKTHFLMSRGSLQSLVELCIPYPPLFKSYKGNVSGINELKASVNFLRSKGATYIVFVNVLQDFSDQLEGSKISESDKLNWLEVSSIYGNNHKLFDQVINIPTGEFSLLDFSKQRDIFKKGLQYGREAVDQMAQNLNL